MHLQKNAGDGWESRTLLQTTLLSQNAQVLKCCGNPVSAPAEASEGCASRYTILYTKKIKVMTAESSPEAKKCLL